MYAIIEWKKNNDDDCWVITNNNGSIMLFSKFVDVDKYAKDREGTTGSACRVITINGVTY